MDSKQKTEYNNQKGQKSRHVQRETSAANSKPGNFYRNANTKNCQQEVKTEN